MPIVKNGSNEIIYSAPNQGALAQQTGVHHSDAFSVCDTVDTLKQIKLDPVSQTTNTTLTLKSGAISADTTITFPSSSGTLITASAIGTFKTIQTPAGTYPVATSSTDVLTYTSTDNSVMITGDASTDTINFTVGAAGVTTMAAIGSSANANGASISGSTLTLQPASGTFGGVLTAGTQTIAGAKTLTGLVSVTSPINTINTAKFFTNDGTFASTALGSFGITPDYSNKGVEFNCYNDNGFTWNFFNQGGSAVRATWVASNDAALEITGSNYSTTAPILVLRTNVGSPTGNFITAGDGSDRFSVSSTGRINSQSLTASQLVQTDASKNLISSNAIPGTATNDNAAAGKVGEYTTANPGSGVTPGSSTAYTTVTSVSLTAGDWDVEGVIALTPAATLAATQLDAAISLTTNAADATNAGGICSNQAFLVTGTPINYMNTGTRRISVGVTTTVYLTAALTYTVLSTTTYGTDSIIRARRVR